MAHDTVIVVPLRDGISTTIDATDADLVLPHKWRLLDSAACRTRYACGRVNGKQISLHRHLMGEPKGLVVDHINGNGLDNRRSNLRAITKQQNSINSRPNRGRRFKGVSALPNGRFRAVVNGSFDTAEEAARAVDRAAMGMHGEFAWLNFPEEAK